MKHKIFSTLLAASAALAAQGAAVQDKPQDWLSSIKDALIVYESDETLVSKVQFTIRQQFQVAAVQPSGSNGSHLKRGAGPRNQEFRRSWIGANVDFRTGTRFHVWARVGGLPERNTFPNGRNKKNYSYTNLFDIWVKQNISSVKGLSFRVGKLSPLFTTEYIASSSVYPCVERSVVGGQHGLDSNWGVEAMYEPSKNDKLFLQLLANDRAPTGKNYTHSDAYRDGRGLKGEFGWEDKFYGIVGGQHQFLISEEGYHMVSAQYTHDFDNTYSRNHATDGANCYGINVQDAISLGYEIKQGKWTFTTNLVANFDMRNAEGSHNVGIMFLPVYALTPHVDLVFRYAGVTGDASCKLGADRYVCTQTPSPTWVDSIHSFYFGADFYASARDKSAAKLMLGAEYLTSRKDGANSYCGWEFTSAIRCNF